MHAIIEYHEHAFWVLAIETNLMISRVNTIYNLSLSLFLSLSYSLSLKI